VVAGTASDEVLADFELLSDFEMRLPHFK